MTEKLSFPKYERDLLPAFRQRINKAESVEDFRKVFAYTTRALKEKIFSVKVRFRDDVMAVTDTPSLRRSAV